MLTTDELGQLMRERSEHTSQPPVDALRQRITCRQRIRNGLLATALSVAVGAPVAAGWDGSGGDGAPTATPSGAPSRTPGQPPEYLLGHRLVDSRPAALPAQARFTYTFTPANLNFQLAVWCDAEPQGVFRTEPQGIAAFVGDQLVASQMCLPGGVVSTWLHDVVVLGREYSAAGRWAALGVRVGQPLTVTVKAHGGTREDYDVPMSGNGSAMLLRYEPVPFQDYPFPPAVQVPQPPDGAPPTSDGTSVLLGRLDARSVRRPNGTYELTVAKADRVFIEAGSTGRGRMRLLVNGIEVYRRTFWDEYVPFGFTLAPGTSGAPWFAGIPRGAPLTVTVVTADFAHPVWLVQAHSLSGA